MEYKVVEVETCKANDAIKAMVGEGWSIHTFTTCGNGYMGGMIAIILFERKTVNVSCDK